MIIDFHTHTFPDRIAAGAVDQLSRKAHILPVTDATTEQLRWSMEKAGIDLSIVLPVATSAKQVEHINDSAAKANENMQETGVLSFGCMHPDFDGFRQELARIQSLGIKGIKIHPPYQETALDDPKYLRIIDRAAELGLIVITHAGEDVGFPGVYNCTPQMSRHVIDEIGPFKFVLAHMGGWRSWDEVPGLLAGTGVYLDTSFSTGRLNAMKDGYWDEDGHYMLDQAEFVEMIRQMGPQHILFGTDCPWADQEGTLRYIQDLPVAEEERAMILGENARSLLGIE